MSECYKHEKLWRQGSSCPYCRIAELKADLKDYAVVVGENEELEREIVRLRGALNAMAFNEQCYDCDENSSILVNALEKDE